MRRVNAALPRPLAEPASSVVPRGRLQDDQGKSLLPPEASSGVFLDAVALGEAATLFKWREEAAAYVRYMEARIGQGSGAEAAALDELSRAKEALP